MAAPPFFPLPWPLPKPQGRQPKAAGALRLASPVLVTGEKKKRGKFARNPLTPLLFPQETLHPYNRFTETPHP